MRAIAIGAVALFLCVVCPGCGAELEGVGFQAAHLADVEDFAYTVYWEGSKVQHLPLMAGPDGLGPVVTEEHRCTDCGKTWYAEKGPYDWCVEADEPAEGRIRPSGIVGYTPDRIPIMRDPVRGLVVHQWHGK